MIAPICNVCQEELSDYGALILSPPDIKSFVRKYHIYKPCYEKIESLITVK